MRLFRSFLDPNQASSLDAFLIQWQEAFSAEQDLIMSSLEMLDLSNQPEAWSPPARINPRKGAEDVVEVNMPTELTEIC